MRLLRGRKRLLKERTRITITVGGLLRLHGVSGEAQKMRGLRDRLDTLSTSHEKMAPHAPEILYSDIMAVTQHRPIAPRGSSFSSECGIP